MFELNSSDDDGGPFAGTIPTLRKGENTREPSIITEAEGAKYQLIYK